MTIYPSSFAAMKKKDAPTSSPAAAPLTVQVKPLPRPEPRLPMGSRESSRPDEGLAVAGYPLLD